MLNVILLVIRRLVGIVGMVLGGGMVVGRCLTKCFGLFVSIFSNSGTVLIVIPL